MKAFPLKQSSFQERVYEILKKVPKGKVTTYKEIAKILRKKSYRAVGNALNKNPRPGILKNQVPCHRVIKSNGEVGGFATGKESKIKLLKKEGIKIEHQNSSRILRNFGSRKYKKSRKDFLGKEKIDLEKYKFDLN